MSLKQKKGSFDIFYFITELVKFFIIISIIYLIKDLVNKNTAILTLTIILSVKIYLKIKFRKIGPTEYLIFLAFGIVFLTLITSNENILDPIFQDSITYFLDWLRLRNNIGLQEWNNFLLPLYKGLIAGAILYILNLVIRIENFSKKIFPYLYEKEESYSSKPIQDLKILNTKFNWLNLIAGSVWKISILGIFFFVTLNIPYIKFIINILTLDFLVNSFDYWIYILLHSSLIALIIGFLPTLIEVIIIRRKLNEYRIDLLKTKESKKTIEELT